MWTRARRSSGPKRASTAIRRGAALLLALLWTATPALAALHAQAEQHRYCVEHQVLEEASSPGASGGGRPAGPRAEALPPTPPGGHEACAFGDFCRFDRSLSPVIPAVGPDLVASAPVMPGTALPPPGAPLFRLAPKTSPPA